MEDYAVYLAKEACSTSAALHQFRILYDQEHASYHFFFEGEEDSLFYMPEARRNYSDKIINSYNCCGKKQVIEIRDMIKTDGYNLNYCLFFVDRDYDEFLGTQVLLDEYTYITDNYSIENDICSLDAVKILIEDVVHISPADPGYKLILDSISAGTLKFYREIRPLIAWILAAMESGCSPNLQNTSGLKDIVTMSGVEPSLTKAGFSNFKRKVVVNDCVPTISAILKWRRSLNCVSFKLWVRGKYVAWYFRSAIISAIEDVNSRRVQAGGVRRYLIPTHLREGRLIELLSGRIPAPVSLQNFYHARLGSSTF